MSTFFAGSFDVRTGLPASPPGNPAPPHPVREDARLRPSPGSGGMHLQALHVKGAGVAEKSLFTPAADAAIFPSPSVAQPAADGRRRSPRGTPLRLDTPEQGGQAVGEMFESADRRLKPGQRRLMILCANHASAGAIPMIEKSMKELKARGGNTVYIELSPARLKEVRKEVIRNLALIEKNGGGWDTFKHRLHDLPINARWAAQQIAIVTQADKLGLRLVPVDPLADDLKQEVSQLADDAQVRRVGDEEAYERLLSSEREHVMSQRVAADRDSTGGLLIGGPAHAGGLHKELRRHAGLCVSSLMLISATSGPDSVKALMQRYEAAQLPPGSSAAFVLPPRSDRYGR